MKVTIEIDNSLMGIQFHDDNGKVVHFEDMSRIEQIRILNSFTNGYRLFIEALKKD